MSIRILLAGRHCLVLQGLRAILSQTALDIEVVGNTTDCDEAVTKAISLQPHVVVVDISAMNGSADAVIRQVKLGAPQTRVLVLSSHNDAAQIRCVIGAGASGYELLDIMPLHFADAIRAVANGKHVINEAAFKQMAQALLGNDTEPRAPSPGAENLTPREREVLARVSRGLGDKEVAAELMLSEATVKSHLRVIYAKLRLHNRAQAAAFAVRRGLCTDQ